MDAVGSNVALRRLPESRQDAAPSNSEGGSGVLISDARFELYPHRSLLDNSPEVQAIANANSSTAVDH
jgi:hypothetical protein